jgi:AAA domain
MIDLKKISRGKESRPPRVLVYSFEGVGKTRFASGAPDPFFLDLDRGSHKYDVARITPETWNETLETLSAIESGKIKCQTVILDSITALEHLGHLDFFPGSSVDMWGGGYGKGDTHVVQKWKEPLSALERIWYQGKAVVLVAHAVVKTFNDPSGPAYDRFEVGVRPKLAGLLRQWTDYVLFCREDVVMVPASGSKGKAATTGTRWAYTRRTPAYDAKARGTLLFPEKFLLSWDEFAGAIASEKLRSDEMGAQIAAMLEELADPSLTKTVNDWLRQYPDKLLEAHQSVTARVEQKRSAGAAPVATVNGGA